MRLLNKVVTPGGGDHLTVLYTVEHGSFPECRSVTPELIGVNDLWYVVFTQQADEKGLGHLSVTVLLKENVQHRSLLVNRPP